MSNKERQPCKLTSLHSRYRGPKFSAMESRLCSKDNEHGSVGFMCVFDDYDKALKFARGDEELVSTLVKIEEPKKRKKPARVMINKEGCEADKAVAADKPSGKVIKYDWRTDPNRPGCQGGEGDGLCEWKYCPQIKDGEPEKSGRHCPRDNRSDE